jgi:hypothetical protein
VCTDPIYRCFNNPEGLNHRDFPSGCGSLVHELTNGLRLGTVVASQDLSATCVTVRVWEPARASAST